MSEPSRRLKPIRMLTVWAAGAVLCAATPSVAESSLDVLVVRPVAADPDIVLAAQRNDFAGVQALLAEGVDLNAAGSDGAVALMWASANHNVEMAQALASAGADPDIVNEYGVGALDLAASANDAPMIRVLLEAGADPNIARWSGQTPLMLAAWTGGAEAVDLLIAAGADLDARERRGQTAMMWAAAGGHVEVVNRLIAAGADLRAATPAVMIDYPTPRNYLIPDAESSEITPVPQGGWAPVHFAAREAHLPVVQALIEAGEDIERETAEGITPLIAALYRHELLEVKPPFDVEVFADLETARFLLERGADPNHGARSGLTPLHAAVFVAAGKDRWSYALDEDPVVTPHDELGEAAVRLLLDHGADPNQKIVDYLVLIPGGLNRHHSSYHDISPFLLAGTMYKDEVQRIMLATGRIDPNAREADGSTLFMQAVMLNGVKTAELLIAAGADVNAVDNQGRTALHFAAMQPLPGAVHAGYPGGVEPGTRGGGDMVELLLAAGAQMDVADDEGQTPLDIASLTWPSEGLATGHVIPGSPQVYGFFFEENQPGRNFSLPAQRLSAKVALERAMGGSPSPSE